MNYLQRTFESDTFKEINKANLRISGALVVTSIVMKQEIPDFETVEKEFQARHRSIHERNSDLTNKLVDQNKRFDKIWDGFIKMKYVQPEPEAKIQPLMSEQYNRQLEVDIQILDEMLKLIEDKNRTDLVESCEKHLIQMYGKLQQRWDTIIKQQELRRDEFGEINKKKTTVVNLFNSESAIQCLEESQLSELLNQLVQTLVEEDLTLKKTEILITELERLFSIRESLFSYSHKLFLK